MKSRPSVSFSQHAEITRFFFFFLPIRFLLDYLLLHVGNNSDKVESTESMECLICLIVTKST